MRILVTGAAGFIGTALCRRLAESEYEAVACSRSRIEVPKLIFVPSPELGPKADWSVALDGAEIVVHLAARAHCSNESNDRKSEALYQCTNEEGTTALARQAVAFGIRHFIYISSIGAVAENSDKPLSPLAKSAPCSPYGRSKLGAEKAIEKLSAGTKASYTIIRPPLVYGPKNPGNMTKLLRLADTSVPLPLSALDSNRRSFVGVSNLIDLILLCLKHPAAANQTFHVSDDDDVSTAELLRRMAKALGKPIRNVSMPGSFVKLGLRMLGKGDWVNKLCGDLRVDISETKRLLGWKPKVTMEDELRRTALWWRESRQGRL